jgi:hypothetical protein
MPILTNVTSFEDKVVDTVRTLQRPVVDTVRKGVERAEGRLPKLKVPTLPRPNVASVNLPRINLPKVDVPDIKLPDINIKLPNLPKLPDVDVPRPELRAPAKLTGALAESAVLRSQVGFARALVATQREFVGDLADALSPLVAPGDAPAKTAKAKKSAPVTKGIAQTATKKTSPKRKSTRSTQTKD